MRSSSIHFIEVISVCMEFLFKDLAACGWNIPDTCIGEYPQLPVNNIAVSYALFEKLFNTPTIRGRKVVKGFAAGFCKRWTDTEITIHEFVEEKGRLCI